MAVRRVVRNVVDNTVSAWASLGRWDRVGVVVGSMLLLSSAGMAIDSRLLRHDEYRHWWVDRETEGSATQLESLLRPLFEQQRLKQHQQDEQEELQREQQELGRQQQQQQQQPGQPAGARKRRWW